MGGIQKPRLYSLQHTFLCAKSCAQDSRNSEPQMYKPQTQAVLCCYCVDSGWLRCPHAPFPRRRQWRPWTVSLCRLWGRHVCICMRWLLVPASMSFPQDEDNQLWHVGRLEGHKEFMCHTVMAKYARSTEPCPTVVILKPIIPYHTLSESRIIQATPSCAKVGRQRYTGLYRGVCVWVYMCK